MNAVQAIEEGSLSKNEIRVRTWSDGEWVMAEVQDTGIGIPPENIPHLFEPFFTTKDVGVGSGLGLSICHNMISAYKGHIHVESKVGKGSRFVVSLPAWRQPRKASVSAEFALATTTAPARGRILIVDDERDICDAVQHMLSDEHEVLVATSGPAAKVILEQDVSFDVVVCDLMMPGVTGIDLYQWVRKRDADLAGRMLFITGGAFTPLARAFLRDVPNRYLEKPFESAALRSAIVELIARLRSAPEGA
jgi:CheY-like chemotaxis protein